MMLSLAQGWFSQLKHHRNTKYPVNYMLLPWGNSLPDFVLPDLEHRLKPAKKALLFLLQHLFYSPDKDHSVLVKALNWAESQLQTLYQYHLIFLMI